MAIKGSLQEASLPDVIQLLSMGRKTGILSVTDRNDFGNIYLNDGKITYATIVNRRDRIGDLLIRDEKITQEELNKAIRMQSQKRNNNKLGTILVEMNLISEVKMKQYLKIQIEETISHLLSWTDGFFNFEPNSTLSPGEQTVSLSTNDLLLEGARRMDEWRVIKTVIKSFKLIPKFKRDYEKEELESADENDEIVLKNIDGKRSVEELIKVCRLGDFNVGKSLYRHITQGALELIRPTKADFKITTKKFDSNLDEHLILAIAFFKSEMYAEARREYEKVIEIDPKQIEALFCLGLIAFYEENYEDAIGFYRKALRFSPKNSNIYNNLGLAFEKINSLSGAITAYQKAIECSPNSAKPYYNLAYLHYQHGNFKQATEEFKKSIEIDKNCIAAYFYLASALVHQGMLDYGLMWYKRALEIEPHNAIINNNLGVLCQHKHMHEEASKHYQEAVRLDPSLAMPHCNLGDLYYRGGLHEKAEVEFKRALELNPELSAIYFKMGNISLKHGQMNKAVEYWKKALEYDPNNALIKRNLKMIKGATTA